MLARAVGFHQPHVEIERTLRDRRAVVDGHRQGIAGPPRMLDQRAQNGCGGYAAEWSDEGPIVVAGVALPATVAGRNARGVVEGVREFCVHGWSSMPAPSSLRA